MDSFFVWAFSAIAIAIGLILAWALSAADPIGRFLRRQPWQEPRMANWSRNEAGPGPPTVLGVEQSGQPSAAGPILTQIGDRSLTHGPSQRPVNSWVTTPT
jgi:hypothetical protein